MVDAGRPAGDGAVVPARGESGAPTGRRVPAGHVTPGQLAYWRQSGLLRPGHGELTQARVIAALRRAGMSLRHIRAATERLRASPAAATDATDVTGVAGVAGVAGASQLRFAVHGQELYVQRDGGAWEGDRAPGQLILDDVVPLVPVGGVTVGPLPGGVTPSTPDHLDGSDGPGRPGGAGGPGGPGGAGAPAGTGGATGEHARYRPARRPPSSDRDQIRIFLARQRDRDEARPPSPGAEPGVVP